MAAELDFEQLVELYYRSLYQFALSLSHSEADAADLTQQTFLIWAQKGGQLRDQQKIKTWLCSALYHEFLNSRRRTNRFPHLELTDMEHELPTIPAGSLDHLDTPTVLAALQELDENYRAPVALFYLEDCAYKEIAEILNLPVGTVKSRLSRGLARLQELLVQQPPVPHLTEVPTR